MSFASGMLDATAANTAEPFETQANGKNFNSIYITVNSAATAPGARIGGPTVSHTGAIGTLVAPGGSLVIEGGTGPLSHNTSQIYAAFNGNAAGDTLSWTINT